MAKSFMFKSLCDTCIWNCKDNTMVVDCCSKYTDKREYQTIDGNIGGKKDEQEKIYACRF